MTALDLVTDAEIAEALRLDSEATPGPWERDSEGAFRTRSEDMFGDRVIHASSYPGEEGKTFASDADAAFATRARALLPKMAAHLAALRVAVSDVKRMWDADEFGGDPLANLFALCGDGPTDLVLVPAGELRGLRNDAGITRRMIDNHVHDEIGRGTAGKDLDILRRAALAAAVSTGEVVPEDAGSETIAAALRRGVDRLKDIEFEAKAADRALRRESGHG